MRGVTRLGTEVRCDLAVPPATGQQLALLWGSKNDTRTARLTINGQDVPLSAGGFDGFRWLVVPVPSGLKGDRHQLLLRPGIGGREAFLAEIRLLAPEGAEVTRSAGADPELATFRATVQATRRPDPSTASQEAFPEMRRQWDRVAAPLPDDASELEKAFRAEATGGGSGSRLYRCRRLWTAGWRTPIRLPD
jgi:hypothetical protein